MAQTDEREKNELPETPAFPAPEPMADGLAEIASDFVDNMPEVSPHAIEAHLAKEKAAESAPAQVDKNGTKFDPTIHTLGADGNPALTKSGLYARKRGRKAGQSTLGSVPGAASPSNTTQPLGALGQGPTTAPKVSHTVMGAGAAVATANVFMAAFGPDLEPSKKNELTGQGDLETLRDAYAQFFLESGIERVPPWIGLAIALSTYAGPKMMKETALSRAKIMFIKSADGVRNLWRKFKGWRSQTNATA